ncbi:hypothetical protein, partial [Emticicia sp. W12TSBA100-4]|uniref:hypothetical protein n=1 Tax=Emticicia sp. W12TSBA100-4 TaxID=3160965 RepID=UPI0033062908
KGDKGDNGSVLPTLSYSTTVNLPNNNPVTITHNLNLSNPDRIQVQLIGADAGNANINNQNIYWFQILNATSNTVQIALNVLSANYYGNHKVVIFASAPETLSIPNSILKNGALEFGNTLFWNDIIIDNNRYLGRLSIKRATQGISIQNVNTPISKQCLYRVNGFLKSAVTGSIVLKMFDHQSNLVINTSGFNYVPVISIQITPNFTEFNAFLGGVGNTLINFSESAIFIRPQIFSNTDGEVLVNSFRITEVSLGEPVPYNIAWLPKGQTVFDPT